MDIDSQHMNNIFDSYKEAESYIGYYTARNAVNNYIELIDSSKQKTNIPVIASINCSSDDHWVDFAGDIQAAGADGLELNMFVLPSDPSVTGAEIEQIYRNIVRKVTNSVSIPVAFKIHHYFSGMANFVVDLSATGIKSLVLFNRFYQPDVDLEKLKIVSGDIFSTEMDNALVIRWLSILSGRVKCDLAASTGIHGSDAAIKDLLVGANTIQVASAFYNSGSTVIRTMLDEMDEWLEKHGYNSVGEIIGKLRQADSIKPMIYERAQFMKYFLDAR